MRIVARFLLLLLAPCALSAQAPVVERVEITNRGIYELVHKNLPGAEWSSVTKIRNVRATESIPARLCISFGFEYTIVGTPIGADVPIKMVTRFPSQGLHNPETRVAKVRQETVLRRTIGKPQFRSFTLESQWEVVAGIWTFEFWYQNRKLGEQSFTLKRPCTNDCDRIDPEQMECDPVPIGSPSLVGPQVLGLT